MIVGDPEDAALADFRLLADAEGIAAADPEAGVIDGRRPAASCACGDRIDVRDLARLSCMREDVGAEL